MMMIVRGDDPTGAAPLPTRAAGGPVAEQNACPPHVHGILVMFQRLRDRWQSTEQMYDIMRQQSEEEADASTSAADRHDHDLGAATIGAAWHKSPLLLPASPHQATSFHRSNIMDIPCINSDEIVFPGSALQKEMAAQLTCAKLKDEDEECVICMEPFSFDNPRMPTLCACGENKTFFHLPCLYQWIEQCENCPSCRQKLAWEEF
jgi:Ring finger domain